ncbi:iron ABC transporter permease [Clostridium fermenticellae]|uniref:Iron ABC transporter permease n=1 Tax=Clostridium fermenticellae TaxID=2068654 RepID=A0A386H2L1_9CLOT|nr:iron ABC transporter permease [Clostridium fermenticellae]AYD39951.1 iron ABC transporter permease [Clostridium fermenticellae]
MSFLHKKHFKLSFCICIILLILVSLISTTLGSANIPLRETFSVMCSKIPFIKNLVNYSNISQDHILIITEIRLPRIITSALVGIGLSVVGASFQAIFKNPMADPYVLGISSGSALGAAIGFILGLDGSIFGNATITVLAFISSILTTLIVYSIARVKNKIPTTTLLLAGVSMGFLLSSLISIIMVFNRQQLDKIVFWTLGSMSASSYNQILTLLPFLLIGSIIILSFSKDLNIMLTGDDTARSLGIDVETVKKLILGVSSIIVAACVSISGVIGFVGLIIPHVVRMIFGPDHKVLLPFSMIIGAIFMIISDTIARTIAAPSEIPIGAITALFGAPYFIYLLIKTKKKVI